MFAISSKNLSLALDVNLSTIRNWVSDGGFKIIDEKNNGGRGKTTMIDLGSFIKWYATNKGESSGLVYQKTRVASAQARNLELKNDALAGKLISVEDVNNNIASLLSQSFIEIKTRCLNLPSQAKLAIPALTNDDIKVLDNLQRETLTSLSGLKVVFGSNECK